MRELLDKLRQTQNRQQKRGSRPSDGPYPPLPPEDGLRLLTLYRAGDFSSPLRGTLDSVTFSSRPRYIALSYTWANPVPNLMVGADPSKASISLGRHTLSIGHNAALALRFLRSIEHSTYLWVDAICINQSSVHERNHQVALMAFIFSRAAAVVSWLGAPRVDPEHFRALLNRSWARGDGRRIAGRLATATADSSSQGYPKSPFSWEWTANNKPDLTAWGARIAAATYWERLWVVQEVCLPRHLAFMCGGTLWTESIMWDFAKGGTPAHSISGHSETERWDVPTSAAPIPRIERLLSARRQRFTDTMRLEALIERFMDFGCANIKDRVFGLLGLANDVDPIASHTVEESPSNDEPKLSIQSRGYGGGSTSTQSLALTASGLANTTQRGRGTLLIDYERSFYDIWCDVVEHMFFQARPLADFGEQPAELEDERRARVVRFAGVVQRAFEGKVEKELSALQAANKPVRQGGFVQAKGYIAGRILHIGPWYTDIVGSHRDQARWIGSWNVYYRHASELEILRQMEERYMSKTLAYSNWDLQRICTINSPDAAIWSILAAPPTPALQPANDRKNDPHTLHRTSSRQEEGKKGEVVRFLASDLCTGFAPAAAEVGDLIVRFWNCDAAIVVRHTRTPAVEQSLPGVPEPVTKRECGPDSGNGVFHPGPEHLGPEPESYGIVGRADVSEPYERSGDGTDDRAKGNMGVLELDASSEASARQCSRSVYVRMDFMTLQKISAAITI